VKLILVISAVLGVNAVAAASCESLRSLSTAARTITAAELISIGNFVPPNTAGIKTPAQIADPATRAFYESYPSICRVAATLRPTEDSEIKIEVWMPTGDWNRKLLAVGNGAWGGYIIGGDRSIADGLKSGYATVLTDTGHTGGGAAWAFGHPEKLVDYAYRAVHETAVAAKTIIQGYYGKAPELSYWIGCSTGGAPGPDGSAALSGRFRRNHSRRSRTLSKRG
jgi:Tannase and feruloyl esterase